MLKSRGFWIGIIVSAVFIGLFARSTDFGAVKRAFEEANYWWVAASLPVYFAGLWVRTIRWQYLLRPVKKITTIRLYPVVIVGLMANNLIPARAGELARAYVLGVRERISKSTALGTIAVDRLFDGVTLVPMMFIVAAFAGKDVTLPVGFGKSLNFAGLSAVMALLFGLALGVLFYLAFSERGQNGLHRLIHRFAPGKLKPKVEEIVQSFFAGLDALRSPVDLGVAWVMSLISWTLEAGMYYMVARAFGINEQFYVFLLLAAAANLAIAVVASQGGVGPFELVVSKTIVAFAAVSADPAAFEETAKAYAIGLHAVLLFPIIIIGLYLMWSMKLTFGDMLKSSSDGGDTPPVVTDAEPQSRAPGSGGATVKPEQA